jgi:hypothetical protein
LCWGGGDSLLCCDALSCRHGDNGPSTPRHVVASRPGPAPANRTLAFPQMCAQSCRTTYPPTYVTTRLSACITAFLHTTTYQPTYLRNYLPTYLLTHPPTRMTTFVPTHPFTYLPTHLHKYATTCLPKSSRSRSYFTTDSQSVCLGIEHHCGTCDQILLPVGMLLSEICCLVSIGRPL